MSNRLMIIGRWGNTGRNTFVDSNTFPYDKVEYIACGRIRPGYGGFSYEEEFSTRRSDIAGWQEEKLAQELQHMQRSDGQVAVMPFYPLSMKLPGITMIQNDYQMSSFVESKRELSSILTNSGISEEHQLVSISSPHKLNYQETASILGEPFFVQEDSRGGRGTYLVHNQDEFETISPGSISRMTKYERGMTLNVCAVSIPITQSECKVFVEYPSLKPMHIRELNGRWFSSCGNEWGTKSIINIQSILDDVTCIGEYIYATYGIKGAWGIDLIYDFIANSYKIIEINSRLQGTHEVASANQLLRGAPSFLLLHFLAFDPVARSKVRDSVYDQASHFNKTTMSLVNEYIIPSTYYVKLKAKQPFHFSPTENFRGDGVYKVHDQWISFEGYSDHTIDARLDNNQILIVNSPKPGTWVMEGIEICMIEGLKPTSISVFLDDYAMDEAFSAILEPLRNLMGIQ